MIKDIWDKAVERSDETGVDTKDVYIDLLESKLETVTTLRDASLKKVTDFLTMSAMMSLGASKDDPAYTLCRKIQEMARRILSKSERDIANDVANKYATAGAIITQLNTLLEEAAVPDVGTMSDEEKFKAIQVLMRPTL